MRAPPDLIMVSITETWRALPRLSPLLTDEEREIFAGLRVEKRRRDWLAGRIAAKRSVQRTSGLPLSRISILPSPCDATKGRPEVWIDGRHVFEAHVTITHSGDLAAACCRREPVGLDIEQISHREPSFEHLLLTSREATALEGIFGHARDAALTELWCVKEAVGKWLGKGLSRPFGSLLVPGSATLEQGRFQLGDAELCWARVTGPSPRDP